MGFDENFDSRKSWILPAMKHFRDICRQYNEEPDETRTNFPSWSNDSVYRYTTILILNIKFHKN